MKTKHKIYFFAILPKLIAFIFIFWLITLGIYLGRQNNKNHSNLINYITPSVKPESSNCGTVSTQSVCNGDCTFSAPYNPDAQTAEECYINNFSSCKPAKLIITRMGIDTGVDYTLSVEKQNSICKIMIIATAYSANFGGSQKTTQYACQQLANRNDGLQVTGCGANEDLNIPPIRNKD